MATNLPKILVRISVVYTAIYYIVIYILGTFYDINYFNDAYIVLIEATLCAVCSTQGNYHCKYLRFTCYGIFICDSLCRLDGRFEFIPLGLWTLTPAFILFLGMATSVILSINHFRKVYKVKKKKKEIYEEYNIRQNNEVKTTNL